MTLDELLAFAGRHPYLSLGLVAAKRLKKAGFEHVHWLDGGIQAWQQADLPLVRGRR